MIPRCYHCNKELDLNTERFIQVDGKGFSFCNECLKEFQETLDIVTYDIKYREVEYCADCGCENTGALCTIYPRDYCSKRCDSCPYYNFGSCHSFRSLVCLKCYNKIDELVRPIIIKELSVLEDFQKEKLDVVAYLFKKGNDSIAELVEIDEETKGEE